MYTYKVVVHPNNKQRTKILRTLNKCIECQNIIYDILDGYLKRKEKFPSCYELRRNFTIIKKEKDNEVIEKRKGMSKKEMIENHLDTLFYDVSNDALKQTIKDTYNAFIRFLKGVAKYPNKKSYKDKKKSFYIDPLKIKINKGKVKLEKIANNQKENRQILNYISLAEKKRIPEGIKYYNPRINYDGEKFYLTLGVDDENSPKKEKKQLEDKVIGIDINISNIVTSEGKYYRSINKDAKIKSITKRLKRIQKSVSRKYIVATKNKRKLRECKNFIKGKRKVRRFYTRLSNIRDDYHKRVVEDIVKETPKNIVIETLDIKQMQQNKKISSYIQISSFRKFINNLKDKCYKLDIKIIEANKYYASSKTCSRCGYIKQDLMLSNRIYKCNNCGLEIDRDYNASLNLINYVLNK